MLSLLTEATKRKQVNSSDLYAEILSNAQKLIRLHSTILQYSTDSPLRTEQNS